MVHGTFMQIILPTYREMGWAVAPFLHCFEKFWGDPKQIVLLAETDYSGGRCTFIEVPQQYRGSNGAVSCSHYSSILSWHLGNISEEYYIIMCADYWIYELVNVEVITIAEQYMRENSNVLRIGLGNYAGLTNCDAAFNYQGIAFAECAERRDCFATVSLTPGLWSKALFMQILEIGHDPWNIELAGREKYIRSFPHWRSILINPEPIVYINAVRGSNPNIVLVEEDIKEVYSMIPSGKQIHVIKRGVPC